MGHTSASVFAGSAPWSCEKGHAPTWLRSLPDACAHCIVTSPPYYGLRAYLDEDHPDKALEIGAEETPEEYVAKMVAVLREAWRVLHPSGTLWLNLGDSYAGGKTGRSDGGENGGSFHGQPEHAETKPVQRKVPDGLKAKDLIGIPWMVAFALRADGWYLRQWCPWVCRNKMPDSTEDRPGMSCETVFLLSRRSSYFFDMEAVKRAATPQERTGEVGYLVPKHKGRSRPPSNSTTLNAASGDTRNLRSADLWFDSVGLLLADDTGDLLGFDVTTKGYKGAHFAVMPKKLIEPCILAGTSARGVCPACGEPWVRVVEKDRKATRPGKNTKITAKMEGDTATAEANGWNRANAIGNRDPERHCTATKTVGWEAGCKCEAGEAVPAVVLDPFAGSGTVLAVAVEHGRRAIGCDLNADNLPLIKHRMRSAAAPLFTEFT